MYIPLGGNEWKVANSFVIFSFVAYWHDPDGTLLTWGWLIALFLLPELACKRLFCSELVRKQLGSYHIHLCAFGAAINIMFMMVANLIGYAVGLEGILDMLSKLDSFRGYMTVLGVFLVLFGGAHRMFYYHTMDSIKKTQ
jgi:D-alanyl-lipoteichoic acid acyltransferase DltB (MBOAT superfamily)